MEKKNLNLLPPLIYEGRLKLNVLKQKRDDREKKLYLSSSENQYPSKWFFSLGKR